VLRVEREEREREKGRSMEEAECCVLSIDIKCDGKIKVKFRNKF
jgi:hypothetical protein